MLSRGIDARGGKNYFRSPHWMPPWSLLKVPIASLRELRQAEALVGIARTLVFSAVRFLTRVSSPKK